MTTAVSVADGTGDVAISASKPARLYGYTVIESAGTPALATAVLRNGASTAGAPVAVISLAASAGASAWFGPQGIVCNGGIFLDRTAGSTTLVVYTD